MNDISSPRAERRVIGFCPASDCNQRIGIVSFRDSGNTNDHGFVIARCQSCGSDLTMETVNPKDAYLTGATIYDVMEHDEAANLPPRLKDPMQVFLEPGEEPIHDAASFNLFRCDDCGAPTEAAVQAVLGARLCQINDALQGIHQAYLKSMFPEPEFTVVRGNCRCGCGADLAFTAYRNFKPNEPVLDHTEDLLISSVAGAENFAEVDGVFTRDECEALLTKLMHRWRLLFPSAVVATPFVGFSFGRKDKFCDIWDRFLVLIDPKSVTLVTRKRTITDFRLASEEDGVDFAVLQKYGLLHPALTQYVNESRFHAKFYAALDEANDRVEALTGSFNFHEGAALENISLRPYTSDQFRRRYLTKLGIPENLPARKAPYCIIVDLEGDQARANSGRLSDVARPCATEAN